MSSLANVKCTVGGTVAQVLYAGAQGDDEGLDQVNVVIPASLVNQGLVNVVLTVQGQAANTVVVDIGPKLVTTQNFYVAPNGNDQWSGTLPAPNAGSTDGPFASLAGAQSAVRNFLAAHSCATRFGPASEWDLLSPLQPDESWNPEFHFG